MLELQIENRKEEGEFLVNRYLENGLKLKQMLKQNTLKHQVIQHRKKGELLTLPKTFTPI